MANEYIDFTDLPPAKGKACPIPQSLEGQVLVVQAADLLQARKIIPDLATWLQCFALYVATLAPSHPSRVPEMMAYQTIIAKASQKYRWPSWVVYDQNFRQEAANNPAQSWTKVEPSIYAQCFTGQAISTANWCSHQGRIQRLKKGGAYIEWGWYGHAARAARGIFLYNAHAGF